ncbi:MAG TPA: hypothetical protein VGR67_07520 [Candidatus Polarisedimenticolia bacterium]|jgi:tetratricopeptide (TPR) repeat protein|nr:hypothetical protein [Candidatus Polarisedimenticolia bacterium]
MTMRARLVVLIFLLATPALELVTAVAVLRPATASPGSSSPTPSHEPSAKAGALPPALLPGLGSYHHPITTKSPEAQQQFDQGLTLVFGFNHEEAIRSFEKAAALDPDAAMPWWGIAYALGPNINLPMAPESGQRAFAAVQKALALSTQGAESERAYIEALAKRYSADPQADQNRLNVDYKNAMRDLMTQYPDDLDAATLYAESLMDLRPWKLWSLDGKPAEGTLEIVAVLESALRRDPDHPGANHYYIHAVEASPNPERGLASARRLESMIPGAGHLVHMPAHIYSRTGDHAASAKANAAAVEADRRYLKLTAAPGMYPLMYYSHNLHFLAYDRMMQGRYADAKKSAEELVAHLAPSLKAMPMVDSFLPTPLFVDLRFGKWDSILRTPDPPRAAPTTAALRHFARGIAYAATFRPEEARKERERFAEAAKKVPPEATFGGTGLSSAAAALAIAASMLDARIAAAAGNRREAIESWRKAVAAQDLLAYDEPPCWYYPIRESLGGELLRDGQAVEAEKVFREDLERDPRNPRSLFGLGEALKAQGKSSAVECVARQLRAAWKDADSSLSVGGL